MKMSVAVGLRCVLNSSVSALLWTEIARQLMLLSVCFSVANFIVGAKSLHAVWTSCMSVELSSCIMRISSTYLK